jgi:hypothetical protein
VVPGLKEDNTPFWLMAKGIKVQESSTSSSIPSSTYNNAQNDLEDEEEQHRAYMIKEFGKKGFKEIKNLMEKLEKKRECLDRQEDLLILQKERNLALEKALAEEKVKVEKLAIDLSLANDSNERLSKENTLINETLASVKATHSELQESFSCLMVKYKTLKSTIVLFEKAPKLIPKQLFTLRSPQVKGAQNVIKWMYKLVLLTWLS